MKKLIGITGPSFYTAETIKMAEEFLKVNFILLCHNNQENRKYWMEKCDAFILQGGVDIHPSTYGKSVVQKKNLKKFNKQRDLLELAILQYCSTTNKPLLGICRGHQILGIQHGIELVMDLCSSEIVHSPGRQLKDLALDKINPMHHVNVIHSQEIYGEILWVNSFHHQGLIKPPTNSNQVVIDGILECKLDNQHFELIELMHGQNWISCQWHPEWDYEEQESSKLVLTQFKNMIEI